MNETNEIMGSLKKLVYITGSGRSGSTLLDMLLNTNSSIAALGEVHRYSISLSKDTMPHRCTCGETIKLCPFWSAVAANLEARGFSTKDIHTTWHRHFNLPDSADNKNVYEKIPSTSIGQETRLFNSLLALKLGWLAPAVRYFSKQVREGIRIAHDSWLLYESVAQSSGKAIVVDGTKSPGRLMALRAFNANKTPIKVIYLLRDGRAVTYARIKRQGISMEMAARIWAAEHKRIFLALNGLKRDVLSVKYESLCENIKGTLEGIYCFLGAESEADINDFRSKTHSLGGNPMRWEKSDTEIRLNEAWRTELTRGQIEEFNNVAGGLNKKLGYEK